MARSRGDEGPVDVIGWGPFALPGERQRRVEAEARRVAKVLDRRAAEPAKTPETVYSAQEPVKDDPSRKVELDRDISDALNEELTTQIYAGVRLQDPGRDAVTVHDVMRGLTLFAAAIESGKGAPYAENNGWIVSPLLNRDVLVGLHGAHLVQDSDFEVIFQFLNVFYEPGRVASPSLPEEAAAEPPRIDAPPRRGNADADTGPFASITSGLST